MSTASARMTTMPMATTAHPDSVFDATAEASPLSRLVELESFCTTHARRPVPSTVDPGERELAEWVILTRRRRAHRAAVDAVQGPWPVRHPDRVQQLRLFALVHGHLPDTDSVDPVERSLANWVLETTYRPDGDPEVALLLAVTPTAAAARAQKACTS